MIHRRVVAVMLVMVLASCSATAPTVPAAPTLSQTPIAVTAQPLPNTSTAPTTATTTTGTASIKGQAVGTGSNTPIAQTVIFLAQVYQDPTNGGEVFALDLANSPASFTDDNGNFQFTNIVPGRYVISLGDFYGVKDIVREANGAARVYTLENDQTVDAGVIQVRPDVSPGR
jgi:hypothetical protein